MKMHPVVHFEMPAEDRKRMSNFYARTFGWQTKQLGPEMGEYVIVTTTESDENGPKKPGIINGGFFMKKVEEAGGKVIGGQVPGQPDEIPGVGLYVAFLDTEGNRVSMLQPAPRMTVRPGR